MEPIKSWMDIDKRVIAFKMACGELGRTHVQGPIFLLVSKEELSNLRDGTFDGLWSDACKAATIIPGAPPEGWTPVLCYHGMMLCEKKDQ